MSKKRPMPVLYIVPPAYAVACSEIMSRMTTAVKKDRAIGDVELLGAISNSFDASAAWLSSLRSSGVNPQEARCVVLWGEVANQFKFEIPSSDTGITLVSIVLPEQATTIPALCLPTRNSGSYWAAPEFWLDAKRRYADLLVNGRWALRGSSDRASYVSLKDANWN